MKSKQHLLIHFSGEMSTVGEDNNSKLFPFTNLYEFLWCLLINGQVQNTNCRLPHACMHACMHAYIYIHMHIYMHTLYRKILSSVSSFL